MKTSIKWRGCALAVLVAAPGCGGGGLATSVDLGVPATAKDGGDDGAVSPDQACAELAQALCAALARCEGVLFGLAYPDVATCVARSFLPCQTSLDAPGSLTITAGLSACAAALPSVSCDDLYSSKLPAACAPVAGTHANGSACGVDGQCQSTYCAKAEAASCGVCGPVPTVGASCANTPCARGLTCGATAKTCVVFAAAGASCNGDHPCLPSLSCVGATMGKLGVCKIPLAAGAPCMPTDKECDGLLGLFCDGQTSTCAKARLGQPGDPCGIVAERTDAGSHYGFTACAAAGHCRAPDGGIAGTCIAPAADGAPCDDTNGPSCLAPAHCAGGLCKIDDPAACR